MADGMLTFDPAPVGHHVTWRWALTPATACDVDDVTLTQNFTPKPTGGAYKQHIDSTLSYSRYHFYLPSLSSSLFAYRNIFATKT